MKSRVVVVFAVLILFFGLVGCGGGGDSSSEDERSFLEGGKAGGVSVIVLPDDQSLKSELAYLGARYNSTMASIHDYNSQYFLIYGGAKTSLSDVYQVLPNVVVDSHIKYVYVLVPNPEFIGKSINIKFNSIEINENSIPYSCIVRQDGGRLKLCGANELECNGLPLIQDVVVEHEGDVIQIELDLGLLSDGGRQYWFMPYVVDGLTSSEMIPHNMLGGNLSSILTTHVPVDDSWPENTIAHGDFRPNPNGFGFPNRSNNNASVMTADHLAMLYGSDLVCFNDSAECKLNALGYFLRYTNLPTGGECYGYSTLSMMLSQGIEFEGKSYPEDYNPEARTTIELVKDDVQGQINFFQQIQMVPQRQAYVEEGKKRWTPTQVIKEIIEGFGNGDPIATLCIREYENGVDVGGHAVLPYAVTRESEEVQRIYIYDNNFPTSTDRFIQVNATNEAWVYQDDYTYGQGLDLNVMEITPISFWQYHRVAELKRNFTAFENEVDPSEVRIAIEDTAGNISGYDFKAGKEVNNIPGTEQVMGYDEGQPRYNVPNNSDLNTLSIITSRDELQPYIDESFRVTSAGIVDEQKILTNTYFQYSVGESYANGYIITQQGLSSDPLKFYAHPSGRIILSRQESKTELTIFFNDNVNQVGYLYTIRARTGSDVPHHSVSMGALVTNDGELELFEFTDTDLVEMPEQYYEITAKIIDAESELVLEKTVGLGSGAAVKVAPQAMGKGLKAALASDEQLELVVSEVF